MSDRPVVPKNGCRSRWERLKLLAYGVWWVIGCVVSPYSYFHDNPRNPWNIAMMVLPQCLLAGMVAYRLWRFSTETIEAETGAKVLRALWQTTGMCLGYGMVVLVKQATR